MKEWFILYNQWYLGVISSHRKASHLSFKDSTFRNVIQKNTSSQNNAYGDCTQFERLWKKCRILQWIQSITLHSSTNERISAIRQAIDRKLH